MDRTQENIRFEAFHSALSYALQKTLSKITLKTFLSCYPQIDSSSLDYMRKQIIKLWQNKAEVEFQKIFSERNLKEKLDDLDVIIQNAENRKHEYDTNLMEKCPDISIFTPSELVKTHIITEKQKNLEKLQDELESLRNTNKHLLQKLNEYKFEINNNLDDFSTIIDDLKLLDDIDEPKEEIEFNEIIEWAVGEITKLD